jgi:hypothetical protein
MKMPVANFGAFAFAASLLFGASVMAQPVSSSEFSTSKSRIKAEYATDKKACASLAGNAKDICVAQAKGKEGVALAELDNSYKPTLKTQNKVLVAKADAIYEVAKQQCDDLAGNPKDVCVKEAKAALTAAKADATVQMKTSAANAAASDKTVAAQTKASSEVKEVRTDAAAEKRAAQYKVEKEKCDAFAAAAKDNCLADAKNRFGKL